MVKEVLEAFEIGKGAHLKNLCIVDATVGLGGHAKEFVKRGVFVIGIDADRESLKIAEEVLKKACPTFHISGGRCYKLLHGNFSQIKSLIQEFEGKNIKGFLFDLGISSFQLDHLKRGFSYKNEDQDLDMRIDPESQKVLAKDLIALLDKKKLTEVFSQVMPFGASLKLANEIVRVRKIKPIETVGDFLQILKRLEKSKRSINTAALALLALRMAVNNERENLLSGLSLAFEVLERGGRIVVISFHSGEDRIVKQFFRQQEVLGKAKNLSKKPILPSYREISENPRSKSARMRIIEKL